MIFAQKPEDGCARIAAQRRVERSGGVRSGTGTHTPSLLSAGLPVSIEGAGCSASIPADVQVARAV